MVIRKLFCFVLGHPYRIINRGYPYIVLECGACAKRIYVGPYGCVPKEIYEDVGQLDIDTKSEVS